MEIWPFSINTFDCKHYEYVSLFSINFLYDANNDDLIVFVVCIVYEVFLRTISWMDVARRIKWPS